MKPRTFLELLVSAFHKWLDSHASLRAAALTYFIILPLPSLFLIIMMVLSQIFGQTDSFQNLIHYITAVVGPTIANLIQQILETAITPFTSILTTITTIIFTSIGAIGAFHVLQNIMNDIWEIPPKKLGFTQKLKNKLVPFLTISTLGLAIIIWTGITAVLLNYITSLLNPLASNTIPILIQTTHIILSFGLATLLFAIMYKQIPDQPIEWKDVTLAATFTGFIFTLANHLIGIILELFTVTSITGAAGAVMILLLWIYLITQLIIYGAALSKVHSEKRTSHSHGPKPARH